MIPAQIDVQSIIKDLNTVGISDYKIEAICGFSRGYVAQLRFGHIRRISYEYGARLFNFWASECKPQVAWITTITVTT